MRKVLLESGKTILLGNEAVVRGALESGVGFAATYPGTPATEIGDTFAEIAKDVGIYFEYSVNEKVAFEAAAAACFSGVRSIVSFKHFGLNVASDSVFPVAYVGTKAGLVIAFADDPNCWSSAQSEQDSRWYARLGNIPMLEPSSPQECKEFTKLAFELSEKFEIPVFLRLTTRAAHMKGIVGLGNIVKGKTGGTFVKDLKKFDNLPPKIMEMHERILKRIEEIREFSERSEINFLVNEKAKSNFGIIVAGVAFDYVMDALEDMKIKIPILKLGMTHPIPKKKISQFIKKFKSVLVVEEIEPILEEEIRSLAKDVNPKLKIFGKEEYLPRSGELTEEKIIRAIEKITKKKWWFDLDKHSDEYKKIKIARRFPMLCPGCPHRATFYSTKKVMGKDTVFGGDIGCYILGIFPPYETQDFILSMGAVQGITHGIKKVSPNQKVVSFIGDSTFFHAGMPGLLNMVYNKSNPLVIVLDNRTTAMTGHQPHPGVGITAMGEQTKAIAIENLVKALGVDEENVKVVDPFNLKQTKEAVKEFMNKDKVAVIVSKRECQLLAVRKRRKAGIKIPKFEIDQKKCNRCGVCLYDFACPAFTRKDDGRFFIEKTLCLGCAVCVQVCPCKAISVMK